MKWKKWTVIGVATLFIAGNLYLIMKPKSKVMRTIAVKEWTTVKEEDLIRTKKAKGIVVPSEEQHAYYDQNAGVFGKFLVKEGDEVQSGTPLFEYSSADKEAAKIRFEAEKTRVEREINGLNDHIDELGKMLTNLPAKTKKDKDTRQVLETSIKQDIQAKEWQKSRLEAEAAKYDELITAEDESLDNLAITSELDGIVKKISHNLKNPVVTIASNEQQIEGVLRETELRSIEENMKVYGYVESSNEKLEGTITNISALPVKKANVKKESEYPFKVTLDPVPEGVVHGSHVNMNIVMKEELGALTVPAKSIHHGKKQTSIYMLNSNGLIEKRKVKEGLRLRDRQAITTGVKKGDIIINIPKNVHKKSSYYTPIKLEQLNKKGFKNIRNKEIARMIGKGFLIR